MKSILNNPMKAIAVLFVIGGMMYLGMKHSDLQASSHREAPLIANDPEADNTDLYAFRDPSDANYIDIIACYVPAELPHGGPNYYGFGEDVAYDIHIKNNAATAGDDLTYRFTFTKTNEDPTTFFDIRLGKENNKETFRCQKSVAGGPWYNIAANKPVPPPNIGPRSIEDPTLGLGDTYENIFKDAVVKASTNGKGEILFCGPADDPFFVDLGGIFDLGETRAGGTGVNTAQDALACRNVHVIAMKIPISTLQKDHKTVAKATNILDGNFVIGVWASASRQRTRTFMLQDNSVKVKNDGDYVQVSRLGMPLTNEAVIPIGDKDYWNSLTPYEDGTGVFDSYFTNPELALYMDGAQFGPAVPRLYDSLKIQTASPTILGNVNFTDYHDGLYVLYGHPATTGTALDTAIFGKYLLRAGQPRSVDLLPIFYTGVPNLSPYQLATGKTAGNPLSAGKPFINNFLPTFGDMLRLNMAVPPTPRNDPKFSSEGIVAACVLGLLDPAYNGTTDIQFIPNMDGFPNGRRLEDDVTRIELQAVGGVALAAIGLFYDDYTIGGNPVTTDLVNVLSYTTGIEHNDTTFRSKFPYVQVPWEGYGKCSGQVYAAGGLRAGGLQIGEPELVTAQNYPNPFSTETNFKYHLSGDGRVTIRVVDLKGNTVAVVEDEMKQAGSYVTQWTPDASLPAGIYIGTIQSNGITLGVMKMTHVK